MIIPKVTISFAQSIDGCIATQNGESRWISGNKTLKLAQKLRRDHDCILIGIETVMKDDPELSCRIDPDRSPVRIILDSKLTLPQDTIIVKTARRVKTIVLTTQQSAQKRRALLQEKGIEIVTFTADEKGRVPLLKAIQYLGERGFKSILVEGGARVITSFLKAQMISKIVITTAPIIIGEGVHAIGNINVHTLKEALKPKRTRVRRMGSDIVWELLLDTRTDEER